MEVLETLETIAETIESLPPEPTVPPIQPVMVINDFQWLTAEFNKIGELHQIIIGFLLFFAVVLLLRYTYKFFRIFF